jgi:hypothetical protein
MTILVRVVDLQKSDEVLHIFDVKWHQTVKDLKDLIHRQFQIPPSRIYLFPLHSPCQLRNTVSIHDLCPNSGGFHDASAHVVTVRFLRQQAPCGCDYILNPISDTADLDIQANSLLSNVRNGFKANQQPTKTDILDCTGGVYFLRNACGHREGVFKPSDEEQGMPLNNKGYTDASLRDHFQPGMGYLREFAAYCMDVEHRAQVPTTLLVQCKHKSLNYGSRSLKLAPEPKTGSLQQFINSSSLFDDYGFGAFSDYEIQKIALFDMRILNCDRNGGNILVVKQHLCGRSRNGSNVSDASVEDDSASSGTEFSFDLQDASDCDESKSVGLELIPIDHGYAFPTKLCINDFDWAWYNFPQVDRPVDQRLVDYLSSINIDQLIDELQTKTSLPEECWFLIRTVHCLLVEAIVKARLTLKQVALLIARVDDGVPSPLEKLIAEVCFRLFTKIVYC